MTIKNATQLLEKVLQDLDDVSNDRVTLEKANAMFRGASVVINIQRMHMKYAEMKGTAPELPFMDNKEKDDADQEPRS